MSFKITIDGVKELEKKLRTLEPKLAKKVIRQALRAGAKIVQAEAKGNAPVMSGALKKSIKVRALKKRKHQYGVQVATGEDWFQGEQFYAAFLEFGTTRMPAQPFLRPAYDSKKTEANQKVMSVLKQGIEQIGAST